MKYLSYLWRDRCCTLLISILLLLTSLPAMAQTSEGSFNNEAITLLLAEKFHQPEESIKKIVEMAEDNAYDTFPRKEHILAVIGIESSFREDARNGTSKGLMQINIPHHRKKIKPLHTSEENVRVGSYILNEYFRIFGSEKAAILSYNSGPGNYLKGKYSPQYLAKYLKLLRFLETAKEK